MPQITIKNSSNNIIKSCPNTDGGSYSIVSLVLGRYASVIVILNIKIEDTTLHSENVSEQNLVQYY